MRVVFYISESTALLLYNLFIIIVSVKNKGYRVKNTIKVLNEMRNKGIIVDYAIGGGIATLFYIEAFLTYDLDIFIIPKGEDKKGIIDISDMYDFLIKKGYKWEGEHIIIEGIPVQFIVANELEEEAIKNAKEIKFENIPTKVFSPEYLVAILLKVGRKKDKERVEKLLEQKNLNKKKLSIILERFKIEWIG